MAFPILAVIGAALSDQQARKQEQEALRAAGQQGLQRILRTRANELGGSPYGGMAVEAQSTLDDITRQSEAQRNNNIGLLLQTYLKSMPKDVPERTIGENHDIPTVDSLGAGNRSGLSMVDGLFGNESTRLYDDDPWGSGTF